MTEIKNCPFCGSKAELTYDSGNEVYGQSWRVICSNCWASGPKFIGSSSWSVVKKKDDEAKKRALSNWNQRKDQS